MPGMLFAASSASKRKLQAFQYLAEKHGIEEKENARGPSSMPEATGNSSRSRPSSQRRSHQTPPDCPRTPAGRISFLDLIANPEDALSKTINATPIDQVEWKNGPGSSEPSCSAKSAQKSKKRAGSSSPISQPQVNQAIRTTGDGEPLNLESMSRSLHTPKTNDPISLLWTNYAGVRTLEETNEPLLPPLPPLSSSPNTPAGQKKDNLRRTASCGVQWPTTSIKKRKLSERDPHGKAKGIFEAKKSAILAKNATNQSRVSALVDSIHQSLLKKAVSELQSPSSSSPLPERYTERLFDLHENVVQMQTIPERAEDGAAAAVMDMPEQGTERSSEFGDMDFDLEDADLLDAIQAATQRPITAPDISEVAREPVDDTSELVNNYQADGRPKGDLKVIDSRHAQSDNSRESAKARTDIDNAALEEIDNFGDDDDDFATELAELADKVDSQDVSNLDGVSELAPTRDQPTRQSLTHASEFDDVFADDDDDEIWAAIDNETSQSSKSAAAFTDKTTQDNRTIKRYLVQNVFESMYKNSRGRQAPEKILSIKHEKLDQIYTIRLRDSWYDSRCTKNSYIHLIGEFDKHSTCVIDDEKNMIILHPDHLISATTVADSFGCERRATLQDRVKATSPAEAPQVYGHLIHEVFGQTLRQNQWDSCSIRKIVEGLVPSYLESLYEINVQPQDAIEYVMSRMPELMGWASIFVNSKLDPEATIRDRNGAFVPMAVNKLLELEEHVWSPMYGLKGNIDATVQIQMQLPGEKITRTLTVPFELKTGKRDSNAMHRAQTALYTLLLSDRYDITITSGILYYLETSKTFRIEGVRNEIKDMIIQRNKLAGYVHDKLDLPPMIKREQMCKRCFAQTSCFTYHKLMESGNGETSGLKEIFNEAVGHLKEPQQVFFKKWDSLLTKEERDAMKFKRELWTMLSTEREALGRCFSNVVIEPGSATENPEAPKINRYTYTFIKNKHNPGFSFTESQITAGEPIVISDEKGHFALANGFVTSVRPMRITVAVDRRLQNAREKQSGFDAESNQVYSAIMEVSNGGRSPTQFPSSASSAQLFRIDKDEFQNGMAVARNNVLRIMEKDLWRARELRQLIIDYNTPTFKQIATAYTLSGPASQQQINVDQRHAIEKVMSAKDYALVLGMPGTGKTTTIAHIIRALVSQGKSVLLTSYTHTAVDNILLKIKDDHIPILRLGATGKVHPDVASFVDLSGIPKKTIAELEASWTKSKVVATTCLGISHAIFNHRKFDYCIVDEASQITLPVCLGPIRLASTFILVGDHFQLPPLVQNKEAQEGGLDVSLFKLLSDAQPTSVVSLEHQYRMAEDIMLLSNKLIYNGRLKCGTPSVASRTLRIPNLSTGLEAHHYHSTTLSYRTQPNSACIQGSPSCWLENALNPSHRVVFLNTDTVSETSKIGAPEVVAGQGTRITNRIEASVVAQLLTTIIRSGVSPKTIGVITFYRSQLALLRSTVKSLAGTPAASELEMHTADKYQGRDKEVIILSCVRSNESHHVGELLKDWRRVNVALTRAKSKLIIVGSLSTLGGSGVPVLEGLSNILKEKSWAMNLPKSVLDLHQFQGMATQTQPQSNKNDTTKLRGGSLNSKDDPKTLGSQTQSTTRMPLTNVGANKKSSARAPSKIIKGGVPIDKFLDRHPLIKDVITENMVMVEQFIQDSEWDEGF